jgi:hypothetical protein
LDAPLGSVHPQVSACGTETERRSFGTELELRTETIARGAFTRTIVERGHRGSC